MTSLPAVLTTGSVLSPAAGKRDDPARIRDAANQFEALMISELLKSARGPESQGWLGTGEDQAGMIGMDLAEQEFARLIASKGGFGLSKTILDGLKERP